MSYTDILRQTNKETNLQTDRRRCGQTNKQTDRQLQNTKFQRNSLNFTQLIDGGGRCNLNQLEALVSKVMTDGLTDRQTILHFR